MREDLLRELPPLALVERAVKAEQAAAALEAVARHLQFVHGVNVLDVQLDAGTIWRLCRPHVQIFVPSCLEIQRIVAIVKVCQFGKEMEIIFGIELCV